MTDEEAWALELLRQEQDEQVLHTVCKALDKRESKDAVLVASGKDGWLLDLEGNQASSGIRNPDGRR